MEGLTYREPHRFIEEAFDTYKTLFPSNPSINGRIFEFLICETLARDRIVPFYYQGKFTQVPNVDFDIVLFHPQKPVVLSAKTSLRERYKQADLEGFALKQVYRNAKSYLLTQSDEAKALQRKITQGGVSGLDACLRADKPFYDALLLQLKGTSFQRAKKVLPLTGTVVSGGTF